MKRIDCPSGGGPARKSFVSSCAPIQTSLGPPFFFLFYLQFWDVVAMQGRIYLQACQRLGGDGPIYSVCCLLPNIEKPLVLHFFFFFFGCESGWNVSVSAAAERERDRERDAWRTCLSLCRRRRRVDNDPTTKRATNVLRAISLRKFRWLIYLVGRSLAKRKFWSPILLFNSITRLLYVYSNS